MRTKITYRFIAAFVFLVSVASAQKPPGETKDQDYAARGAFAAFVVTDLNASVRWYESKLGLHEVKRGRSPRVAAQTVILGGHNIFVELIYYDDRALMSRHIDDTAPVAGPIKTGVIVSQKDFDALAERLRDHGAPVGVFEDKEMDVRTFIVKDNDGNLFQFFANLK
jgi:catechol 2,3-dioxygenase-like lactoylglutathione lyase family enzyme